MSKKIRYPRQKGFSEQPAATTMRKDAKYHELQQLLIAEKSGYSRFVDVKEVKVYHKSCNKNPCQTDLTSFVSKMNKLDIGKFGVQMKKDKDGNCLGWEVGKDCK